MINKRRSIDGLVAERFKELLMVLVLTLALVSCATGWTSGEKEAVTDVCLNNWGGSKSQCDCVAEATEKVYPDFDDFSKTTALSRDLERALWPCGVGRN